MVVRRALGISGITQAVTFALGIINVVVVSRLLRPEEIGIFSVAVSALAFAHIFREFGVGEYLVHTAKVGRPQIRAAFTVALLTSWSIAAVLMLARSPMASFYGNAGIAEVLTLLAFNFLIMPFGTPVLAMLRRDLQFSKIAWSSIFSAAVQTSVTIGAAMAGESYLSMAWGSIAMQVSRTLLLNVFRPGETFVLPTTHGLRAVLRFGSVVGASSIIRQLGSSAPDLILGRTQGFVEVAFYSRGVGLHRMVVERINTLVRTVHFPTFARDVRAGGDAGALYARATNYLLAVTAPLLAVLAVLSQPLILFVFGAQWERSVPIAALVCSGLILTAPYTLCALSLTAAGKVGLLLQSELASTVVRILVLLTSIWLSLEQVVSLLLLAYLTEAALAQLALKRAFGLSWTALMKETWRALALVPFAIAGPASLVLASWKLGFADSHRLIVLAVASNLALLGWLIGIVALRHPMKGELLSLLGRLWVMSKR